ncbi:MAG: hypothetical protein IJX02_07495 [Clostridia bacterium]|nr:hypothetical protein [Clostridia bacterium]
MSRLEEIDKNFKIETNIDKSDIKLYSVLEEPFCVYGVKYENGKFRRMPENVAKSVNEGVARLHTNTSGGRVRFKTDSSYIAIVAKMCNIGKMDHFAITGSGGFDMYVRVNGKDRFNNTFRPHFDFTDGYESIFEFNSNEMREITINFPLYSDVCSLYIGLEEKARIQAPTPYVSKKPIVYYGHSMTQGGCASRPGNSYPSILSRSLNMDFINLGFSGSARGEREIAEYIASLDMELFVYDYDHNAPSWEHLQSTHEAMFKIIRGAHPTLPIIMMTSTSMERCQDNHAKRRKIIYQTYKNALDSGDKNVYFWDADREFAPYAEYGTVEGCHPNDHGFVGIATSLEPLIKAALK